MASCNLTLPISGTECIGDSRVKINNNFTNLENIVCTLSASTTSLSANTINVVDSSTVDLTYNSTIRSLTATVNDNSLQTRHIVPDAITYSKLASLSSVGALSAEAVQPRLTKAWANFNGSTLAINAAYNVSSITRVATGLFRANLIIPLSDISFAALASCSGAAGYNDVNAQTSTGNATYLGVSTTGTIGSTQAAVNATNISVASFAI